MASFQTFAISTGDPLWWLDFIAREANVELPMLIMEQKSEEYQQYQLDGEGTWLLVLDDDGIIQYRDSGKDLDYHSAFDIAKALLESMKQGE